MILIFYLFVSISHAFIFNNNKNRSTQRNFKNKNFQNSKIVLFAKYGPQEHFENFEIQNELKQKNSKNQILNLINELKLDENQENWPSTISRYLDILLSLQGFEGVNLFNSALSENPENKLYVDTILDFLEEFVDQAQSLNKQHQTLLGEIITNIKSLDESELNDYFVKCSSQFTPGFLRHVEGECKRIQNAPSITPESTKLLQLLLTIQTRILEELAETHLSEAAPILSQCVSYEEDEERCAVLEMSLLVRGTEFANEMLDLVDEALDGFKRVEVRKDEFGEGIGAQEVDPELVRRCELIQEELKEYISSHFQ